MSLLAAEVGEIVDEPRSSMENKIIYHDPERTLSHHNSPVHSVARRNQTRWRAYSSMLVFPLDVTSASDYSLRAQLTDSVRGNTLVDNGLLHIERIARRVTTADEFSYSHSPYARLLAQACVPSLVIQFASEINAHQGGTLSSSTIQTLTTAVRKNLLRGLEGNTGGSTRPDEYLRNVVRPYRLVELVIETLEQDDENAALQTAGRALRATFDELFDATRNTTVPSPHYTTWNDVEPNSGRMGVKLEGDGDLFLDGSSDADRAAFLDAIVRACFRNGTGDATADATFAEYTRIFIDAIEQMTRARTIHRTSVVSAGPNGVDARTPSSADGYQVMSDSLWDIRATTQLMQQELPAPFGTSSMGSAYVSTMARFLSQRQMSDRHDDCLASGGMMGNALLAEGFQRDVHALKSTPTSRIYKAGELQRMRHLLANISGQHGDYYRPELQPASSANDHGILLMTLSKAVASLQEPNKLYRYTHQANTLNDQIATAAPGDMASVDMHRGASRFVTDAVRLMSIGDPAVWDDRLNEVNVTVDRSHGDASSVQTDDYIGMLRGTAHMVLYEALGLFGVVLSAQRIKYHVARMGDYIIDDPDVGKVRGVAFETVVDGFLDILQREMTTKCVNAYRRRCSETVNTMFIDPYSGMETPQTVSTRVRSSVSTINGAGSLYGIGATTIPSCPRHHGVVTEFDVLLSLVYLVQLLRDTERVAMVLEPRDTIPAAMADRLSRLKAFVCYAVATHVNTFWTNQGRRTDGETRFRLTVDRVWALYMAWGHDPDDTRDRTDPQNSALNKRVLGHLRRFLRRLRQIANNNYTAMALQKQMRTVVPYDIVTEAVTTLFATVVGLAENEPSRANATQSAAGVALLRWIHNQRFGGGGGATRFQTPTMGDLARLCAFLASRSAGTTMQLLLKATASNGQSRNDGANTVTASPQNRSFWDAYRWLYVDNDQLNPQCDSPLYYATLPDGLGIENTERGIELIPDRGVVLTFWRSFFVLFGRHDAANTLMAHEMLADQQFNYEQDVGLDDDDDNDDSEPRPTLAALDHAAVQQRLWQRIIAWIRAEQQRISGNAWYGAMNDGFGLMPSISPRRIAPRASAVDSTRGARRTMSAGDPQRPQSPRANALWQRVTGDGTPPGTVRFSINDSEADQSLNKPEIVVTVMLPMPRAFLNGGEMGIGQHVMSGCIAVCQWTIDHIPVCDPVVLVPAPVEDGMFEGRFRLYSDGFQRAPTSPRGGSRATRVKMLQVGRNHVAVGAMINLYWLPQEQSGALGNGLAAIRTRLSPETYRIAATVTMWGHCGFSNVLFASTVY